MSYEAPGRADTLAPPLLERWNETIVAAHAQLSEFDTRFFVIDPSSLGDASPAPVEWFADPLEPAHCLGAVAAQRVCDHGLPARQLLHDEYCEYRIVARTDASGRRRPKRVEVTTELREYWLCLAEHDPPLVRETASSTLGREVSWKDLYGVSTPEALAPAERRLAFARLVAGGAGSPEFEKAGVPVHPTGPLNRDHLLFMTHPINGLDDLLFIVMFGARPYAHVVADARHPALLEQIFAAPHGSPQLFCRHADPAAAAAAHAAAFEGRSLAFANPLGMYIRNFTAEVFAFDGGPLPEQWIRPGRGFTGAWQRLEIGPGDDDDVFLDDIVDLAEANERPLVGGYQIVRQIEVGPLVAVGAPSLVSDDEFVALPEAPPIACGEADFCANVRMIAEALAGRGPRGFGLRPPTELLQLVRTGPRQFTIAG